MTEKGMVYPDRIYIQESDRDTYDKLKNEKLFKTKNNIDLFIIAMMIGFKNKTRIPLKKKDGFVLTANIPEKELHLILALAISEKADLSALLDLKNSFSVSEEYANGGIHILKDMALGSDPGSLANKLESMLQPCSNIK